MHDLGMAGYGPSATDSPFTELFWRFGCLSETDNIRTPGVGRQLRADCFARTSDREVQCDIVLSLLADKRTYCDESQKHVDDWDCYGCAGSLRRQVHFRAGQVHPASARWASVL